MTRPVVWLAPFVLVTAVLVLAPRLTDPVLPRAWALLAALVVTSVVLRSRGVPDRDRRLLDRLGGLLPPGARDDWRAEMAAVLDHVGDGRARRREVVGYVLALPATLVCCWRLHRTPR